MPDSQTRVTQNGRDKTTGGRFAIGASDDDAPVLYLFREMGGNIGVYTLGDEARNARAAAQVEATTERTGYSATHYSQSCL